MLSVSRRRRLIAESATSAPLEAHQRQRRNATHEHAKAKRELAWRPRYSSWRQETPSNKAAYVRFRGIGCLEQTARRASHPRATESSRMRLPGLRP